MYIVHLACHQVAICFMTIPVLFERAGVIEMHIRTNNFLIQGFKNVSCETLVPREMVKQQRPAGKIWLGIVAYYTHLCGIDGENCLVKACERPEINKPV